jgi:hypothetical protein
MLRTYSFALRPREAGGGQVRYAVIVDGANEAVRRAVRHTIDHGSEPSDDCNVNQKPTRQAGIVTRHGSWETISSTN